jgi:hypothetical protein
MTSKRFSRTKGTKRPNRPLADIFKPDNGPPPTLERHEVLPLRLPSEEEKAEFERHYVKSKKLLRSPRALYYPLLHVRKILLLTSRYLFLPDRRVHSD